MAAKAKNAKATKKVAKKNVKAAKAEAATDAKKVANNAPEREPLHAVYNCEKITDRETILKLQRAVRRIFQAGEQSRTAKLNLKVFEYGNLKLLQQNPNTAFGRRLAERGINPLRSFWILDNDGNYLGAAVFVGTFRTRLFVFPKEGKTEEITAVLED